MFYFNSLLNEYRYVYLLHLAVWKRFFGSDPTFCFDLSRIPVKSFSQFCFTQFFKMQYQYPYLPPGDDGNLGGSEPVSDPRGKSQNPDPEKLLESCNALKKLLTLSISQLPVLFLRSHKYLFNIGTGSNFALYLLRPQKVYNVGK